MYRPDWKNYYFKQKPIVIAKKWQLLREVGKQQVSSEAQLKLEWMIFYHTVGKGNARDTAKHFGITPKTFYKWFNRFNEKNLVSLEEQSRAPEKTRRREISGLQKNRIRTLRKKHMRWGKMKLQKRYIQEYGIYISSWKIQKVIEEEQLYYDKATHSKEKNRRKQAQKFRKKRITELTKKHNLHHLWHVDTIVFTLSQGGYRYLLTAIDEVSKLAYARAYTSHSSKHAADFLKRLHYLTEGEMINVHHDNGSEFAKDFIVACQQLSLPQWYSRVRTPTDNPVLERFNRTIQEEFVDMTDVTIDVVQDFNTKLLDWLIEYNAIRPHQTLDYLSPLEYIDSYLLPMSSSRTCD